MFRPRQKFQASDFHPIFVIREKILESGVVESAPVDISSTVLPSVENFDLGAMLKAGVPLKQVNCRLITPSSVSIPDAEVVKTENKKEN